VPPKKKKKKKKIYKEVIDDLLKVALQNYGWIDE
jgi:hypothetical protein